MRLMTGKSILSLVSGESLWLYALLAMRHTAHYMTSSTKLEVYITYCTVRMGPSEPRRQVTCTQNFCFWDSQVDRQTYRHTHRNTSHPHRGAKQNSTHCTMLSWQSSFNKAISRIAVLGTPSVSLAHAGTRYICQSIRPTIQVIVTQPIHSVCWEWNEQFIAMKSHSLKG